MERRYKSGNVIERSRFWVSEGVRPRSKKKASTTHRQQDVNDRAILRRLGRLINCNFTAGDLLLTLTFSEERVRELSERADERNTLRKLAEADLRGFLRRLRDNRRRRGLPCAYIAVAAITDGEGETVRIHCHVVTNHEEFDTVAALWKHGNVDYKKLRRQSDYSPITAYMLRQRLAGERKPDEKSYIASRNLKQPEITERLVSDADMTIPAGAYVLEKTPYVEGGAQYARYVLPKRRKGATDDH